MQIGAGGVGLSSELFSANGVVRGTDVMCNSNAVFIGSPIVTAAGVSGPALQLVNPVASGRIIFIDAFDMLTSATQTIVGDIAIAQLATLNAQNRSCKSFGASGVGLYYIQTSTPAAITSLGRFAAIANTTVQVPLAFPIELTEGGVYTLYGTVALSTLACNFYCREFTV